MASDIKEIDIENIGAIERVRIPIPAGGGVVELTGEQGCGKSTAVRAINATLGGKSRVPLRDGAKRGSVTIGTATLKVTPRTNKADGELVVSEVESDFDLSALIDPGITDPERADAARIKELVKLSGVDADPSLYYGLLGIEDDGQWEELDIEPTDDPLLLGTRIKRHLGKVAKDAEGDAERLSTKASTLRETVDQDVPLDGPTKEETRKAYDNARRTYELTQEQRRLGLENQQRTQEATEKIATLREQLVDPEKIQKDHDDLVLAQKADHDKLRHLEREIATLESVIDTRDTTIGQLEQKLADQTRLTQQVNELEAVLGADQKEPPTVDEIREAKEAMDAAHAAMMARENAERHAATLQEVETLMTEVNSRLANADQTRKAIDNVDALLTSQVDLDDLVRIEHGRLVVSTDRSANEPFAELSHGERTKLAIQMAAHAFAKLDPDQQGMLTIPQEAYDALQPKNKDLLDREAKRVGLVIIAATVTDDATIAARPRS